MFFDEISQALIDGRAKDVELHVRAALDGGVRASDVLEHGLIAGMAVIGTRFRANEIFVPEVLIAARAMKSGMSVLEPLFASEGITSAGTVVLGTVKGDIHDIGKNLVAVMLRGAGFKVIDIGVNAGVDKFCRAVDEHNADIVGLSALLTTTMPQMRFVVSALRDRTHSPRIMVGGAPLSAAFADDIGADAYGRTATDAVDIAQSFMVST